MLTALEIFTNPNDLEITIGRKKGDRKFAIGIFRGPGHSFKPLLTSEPFAEKFEGAVEAVKDTLEHIQQAVMKEFEDKDSIPSQYLNPDSRALDQSKILNPDLINRILDELRQHKVARTYRTPVTAS